MYWYLFDKLQDPSYNGYSHLIFFVIFMIVTIGWAPGSWKSTVAKALSEKLWYTRLYAWALFREKAEEFGMTMGEFADYLKNDSALELSLDKQMVEQCAHYPDVIYETRVGKALMPDARSVFLDVSMEEAAKRIFEWIKKDSVRAQSESGYHTIQEAYDATKKRKEDDAERYQRLYDINIYDLSMYDLVVDTSDKTPEEVIDVVYRAIIAKISS